MKKKRKARNKDVIEKLNVLVELDETPQNVGVLALDGSDLYFEYSDEFQKSGLEISPFRLSLKQRFFKNPGRRGEYNFLPGVFVDSLAEGWGSQLRAHGQKNQPQQQSILQRLAVIGDRGLGALRYEPANLPDKPEKDGPINLNKIARAARRFAQGKDTEPDENLLFAGSYVGGSTPKAMINIDPKSHKIYHGVYASAENDELYIVKFPQQTRQHKNLGALEYLYSVLARKAGVDMTDTKLLELGSERYFAIKRFDRADNRKLHMHSLENMIDAPFDTPVPYEAFFKATMFLTKDMSQVEEVYRRMCLNIALHNRDDHPGNHAFLMNAKGEWRLSPAYDLSYAQSPGKHLQMRINGKAEYTQDDLVKIGVANGLSARKCRSIQKQIKEALAGFSRLAKKLEIEDELRKLIMHYITQYFGQQLGR